MLTSYSFSLIQSSSLCLLLILRTDSFKKVLNISRTSLPNLFGKKNLHSPFYPSSFRLVILIVVNFTVSFRSGLSKPESTGCSRITFNLNNSKASTTKELYKITFPLFRQNCPKFMICFD